MGIENLAKGVLSQTVTPALKKVAGQIGGIIGSDIGRDSRDAVGRNPSVEETKNLCFPKDLLTDNFAEGNHGHYIQFFINHQDEAKLTFGERVKPNLNDEVNNRSLSPVKKESKNTNGGGLLGQFNTTLASLAPEFEKLESQLSKVKTQRLNELAANNPLSDGTFATDIQDIIADRGLESELENLKSSLMSDGGVTNFNELKTKFSQTAKSGAVLAQMENFKQKLGLLAEDIQDPSIIDDLETNVIPQVDSVLGGAADQLMDAVPSGTGRTQIGLGNYTTINGGSGGNIPIGMNRTSGSVNSETRNKKDKSVIVKRAGTTKLQGSICLFMPASVAVTHTSNYTDTEIGFGTQATAAAFESFKQQRSEGVSVGTATMNTLKQFGGEGVVGVGQAAEVAGFRMLGVLPLFRGAREVNEMRAGSILANRMELAFKGINKRAFQYTFKMLPKSSQEADEIRKIVYAFKHAMTPEFKEGEFNLGREMIVPDTFNIHYMYRGSDNTYLHKIGECVLETMSIQYGGDRYRTHGESSSELDVDGLPITGAPPVETTITLNFKELGMVDRKKVKEGF
tara:strand:+ start:186 stop:1889 length:1704 start_codon:yes stop_codon:yes gene_type:complete